MSRPPTRGGACPDHVSEGAEVLQQATLVVGPGFGSRGRGQACRPACWSRGRRRRRGPALESGILSVVPQSAGPAAAPSPPACARAHCTGSPGAEAPVAAGGGWREDPRARAPCKLCRREAAGGRDAMSMEDPFFVVKG